MYSVFVPVPIFAGIVSDKSADGRNAGDCRTGTNFKNVSGSYYFFIRAKYGLAGSGLARIACVCSSGVMAFDDEKEAGFG